MGPILEALYNLQKIEVDMAKLRRRVKLRQNATTTQQKRIEDCQVKIDALNLSRRELQMKYDRYELDQSEGEAKVQKSREELNMVRTNKEYSAVLTQINTFKADMAKLDEVGIEILAKIEAIVEEIATAQKIKEEEEGRYEAEKDDTHAQIKVIEDEIERLQEKSDEAAGKVQADALAKFKILSESYEGEAMAEVDCGEGGFSCSGCFMSINSEHVNSLSSKDEIRFCDNCGRILFLKETPQRG